MTAAYPGAIPSFTTKVDQDDINFAAHVNRLQDEVEAITQELGELPKGSSAHVRGRLESLTTGKANTNHTHHDIYWQRSLVTSKGQLLVGTGDKNLATLEASSNGRVLVSDSSTQTGMRFSTLTHSVFSDLGQDHYTQYALADGSRGAFLPLAGGVMSGPVTFHGYREKILELGSVLGNTPIPMSGETALTATLSGDTAFIFEDTEDIPNDEAVSVTLHLTQGGSGNHAMVWPSSVTWVGSGSPAPQSANQITLVSFVTFDGGTSWVGISLLQY